VVLFFVGGAAIINSKWFKKISLEDKVDEHVRSAKLLAKKELVGKEGEAYTVLRPSGMVKINDDIYDAYTSRGFIEKGEKIVVINDEGVSIKVKKV
jgi:membrane-bound serine protease (ClpP class)